MGIDLANPADHEAALRAALRKYNYPLVTQNLTTGDSPVDLDTTGADATYLIYGGTGGTNNVNLLSPSGPEFFGKTHVVVCQTNPDVNDIVIKQDGQEFSILDAAGNVLKSTDGGAVLSNEENYSVFVWNGNSWTVNNEADASNSSFTLGAAKYLPAGSSNALSPTYYGLGTGGSSPTLAIPHFGLVEDGNIRLLTSAVDLTPLASSTSVWLQGGATGIVLRMPFVSPRSIGKRYLVVLVARDGSETALLKDGDGTMTGIADASGNPVTSITFNAVNQYCVLEAWDTDTWRIVRTTADVV